MVTISLILQIGISFLSQIFMARLITPKDFGVVAMAMITVLFFQTIFDTQGDKFIIQTKEDAKHLLNSIITLELILSCCFSILIFLFAKEISNLLGGEDITKIIRLLTLSFLAVPFLKIRSLFEKDLLMIKSKGSQLISQFLASVIGITFALKGYGIYSIVFWRISSPIFDALILLILIRFRIKIQISKDSIIRIYKFTKPLIVSAILVYFIYNIDYYIVGHFENYEALGFYWLAFQVSHYFLKMKTAINSVLFPAFTKVDSLEEKITFFHKSIKFSTLIYSIPTIIIFLFGDYLIQTLYGEQWSNAVFPFKIFFLIVTIKAISGNIGPFFFALGKTKQESDLAIINAISLPTIVSIGVYHYGINGAAIGVLISSSLSAFYAFIKYVQKITKKNLVYYFRDLFILVTITLMIKIMLYISHSLLLIIVSPILLIIPYYIIFKKEIQMLIGLIFKLKYD